MTKQDNDLLNERPTKPSFMIGRGVIIGAISGAMIAIARGHEEIGNYVNKGAKIGGILGYVVNLGHVLRDYTGDDYTNNINGCVGDCHDNSTLES